MAVLNKHHGNIPKDAIYIGRGSRWGNPFVIGKDGNRDEVINKYRNRLLFYYQQSMETFDEELIKALAALHGKNLVCFCAPKRCHGHILEEFAAWAHEHLDLKNRTESQ